MEILQGALAFSVVMIILATVATGLTEAWLRMRRRRQVYLAQALAQMLLAEKAAKTFPKEVTQGEFWCERVVDKLTFSPVHGKLEDLLAPKLSLRENLRQIISDHVSSLFATTHYAVLEKARKNKTEEETEQAEDETKLDSENLYLRNIYRVDALSPVGFAERVANLPKLSENLGDDEDKWTGFVKSYARYRLLSQERFRKSAQATAIVAGFFIAFAYNIDAGRIFTHVMTDTKAQEALIGAAPEIIASYEEAQRELATASGEQAQEIQDELDDLRGFLQDNLASLEETANLPVGLAYYPHCTFFSSSEGESDGDTSSNDDAADGSSEGDSGESNQGSASEGESAAMDSMCIASEAERGGIDDLVLWAINATIAGFLIGLGGPFWYRVFSSLSQLTQLLKSFGGGASSPETQSAAAATGPGARQSEPTLDEQIKSAVKAAIVIVKARSGPTEDEGSEAPTETPDPNGEEAPAS
ncbi:MAG: hypothetical protein AAGF71_14375 [Pseudomonadota bacterium]